jgi:outer membrane protein TolC
MFWGSRILGVLVGLAVLLAPGGVRAAEGPVFTLQQLVTMALKYSPEVKAKKSEVTLAEEQKAEARGYYFPQFDALVLGGLAPNARLPFIRDNAIVYPDPKYRAHGVNVFGRLEFTLIQPLYTFGKIAYRDRAAAKNVKVKEAGVVAKQGDVMFQVAQAYYGLILAQQGKEAVRDAQAYLTDARGRAKRLLEIRSPHARESDLYRLAVYEGGVEKFGAQAEEGAKVAYQALKALIGYGPDQNFQTPRDLPAPTQAPFPLAHYIQEALDLRPEFTQLKEGLVARQLLVDAAKADQLPSFFAMVSGAFAGAPGRDTDPSPFHEDYYNTYGAGPMLGMKWHFDFGITRAKIRQAQAELQQLKETQKTALMGIPVEVGQAYAKVQENYKASTGLEKSYVNARRWLVTAFSNFDMGIGKMDDIFEAFEKYGAFRGDYLLALYQYNLASAELEKATGGYRRSLAAAAEAPLAKPLSK